MGIPLFQDHLSPSKIYTASKMISDSIRFNPVYLKSTFDTNESSARCLLALRHGNRHSCAIAPTNIHRTKQNQVSNVFNQVSVVLRTRY